VYFVYYKTLQNYAISVRRQAAKDFDQTSVICKCFMNLNVKVLSKFRLYWEH